MSAWSRRELTKQGSQAHACTAKPTQVGGISTVQSVQNYVSFLPRPQTKPVRDPRTLPWHHGGNAARCGHRHTLIRLGCFAGRLGGERLADSPVGRCIKGSSRAVCIFTAYLMPAPVAGFAGIRHWQKRLRHALIQDVAIFNRLMVKFPFAWRTTALYNKSNCKKALLYSL